MPLNAGTVSSIANSFHIVYQILNHIRVAREITQLLSVTAVVPMSARASINGKTVIVGDVRSFD
jgi:hypothetical protein